MFTHDIAGGKEAQPHQFFARAKFSPFSRPSYLEILNIYALTWPDLNKIVLSSRS